MKKQIRSVVKQFRPNTRSMFRDTISDGRERGFFVLRKRGELYKAHTEVGTSHSVMLSLPEPHDLGSEPSIGSVVGSFHTHPNSRFDELFSLQDISSLINGNLEFAGIAYKGKVKNKLSIFVPKGFDSSEGLESSVRGSMGHSTSRLSLIREANRRLHYMTVRL